MNSEYALVVSLKEIGHFIRVCPPNIQVLSRQGLLGWPPPPTTRGPRAMQDAVASGIPKVNIGWVPGVTLYDQQRPKVLVHRNPYIF